ncbi:amino acid/polyamine transporter I [Dichotomocladium elegans]|nr:amino acid/polyamine transporter I [Dichotomocladium elegans]
MLDFTEKKYLEDHIEKVIAVESLGSVEKDVDAERLAALGYKAEFAREISLFVQAGFSFSTMAVLPNWLIGFGGAMSAGGPVSLFWGIVVVAPFVMFIALAMAEIFSAYPVNGGVYSWCYLLSSPEWGPLMSWICGYMFVASLLTSLMTVAYTMSEYIVAIGNILNVHQVESVGTNIGIFAAVLILGVAYSYLGLKFNGYLNRFMVFWVIVGTMVVVIIMPAMAETHPSPRWVFTEFQNTTGWNNSGLSFLLGMLQAGWTLLGYENGAHLAEGTKNADITGPRGIIISVLAAIVQALVLCIGTLFSIQDIEELQSSSFPVATLFVRATNKSVSAFFMVILIVAQFGCLCNIIVANGQLIWSMARDGCIPNSEFWYKLHGDRQVPLRIFLLEISICIALILPAFGSAVYWSAIMSTAVVCANVAYGLPYVCRLIWKRHDMPKGRFDLGIWSLPINILAVLWILFFGTVLCIPSINPVSPDTMNWSCLMIGAVVMLCLTFWFFSGRKTFRGPKETAEH